MKQKLLYKLKHFYTRFYNFIGIDLGTSKTIVWLHGHGFVFNEPTLVALNAKTGSIDAIGKQARILLGRTPPHIEIIQPIKKGVVSHFDIAQQLFLYILKKTYSTVPKLFGPVVVVGAPCGIKEIELNALKKIVLNAGASSVNVISEPIAAAVGASIPIKEYKAVMIIDIGGGTSDIMVISDCRIIFAESVQIAGDVFNRSIIKHILKQYGVEIGIRSAEDIKIKVMKHKDKPTKYIIRGKDTKTHLPKKIILSLKDICNFLQDDLIMLVSEIKAIVEKLSPEILSDLKDKRVFLVGGGAYVVGLKELIEQTILFSITIPKDPTLVVVKGTAKIAKNKNKYLKYFL